jgi:GxxExxY protein
MVDIIYPEESYAIVGACFNVYNEIGPGFLEAVYQECLEIEFDIQRIPMYPGKLLQQQQAGIRKNHPITKTYSNNSNNSWL